MPKIYLKQTGTYYPGDSVSITVKDEEYPVCKLFKRFNHTLDTKKGGPIWLYNGKQPWGNCLTIKTSNRGSQPELKEAHVYFNKYDNDQTPLVLVFKFQNGANGDKYYKRSEFKSKLSGGTEDINSLQPYRSEKDILKDLLTENDSLQNILTYNIGKREGDRTSDNGNGRDKYNGGKIKIEDDSTNVPKLSGSGFNRYKHTPANGDGSSNKNACVIYDGNVLLGNGDTELRDIQKEQYKCIRVYMGQKAKKESVINKKQIDVPLLIELNKKLSADGPDYYVHKKNPDDKTYYWQKLTGTNGNGNTLKELLTDMGFAMSKGETGYEQLKKLLSSIPVNGVGPDQSDLSTKLKEVTGKQLQTMLKHKVGEGGSGSPKSFLELLLAKIEFDLLDSVIVLLEKTSTDKQYYESAVSGVILKLEPKREINRVKMNNGDTKKIEVKDVTEQKGKCVQKYKYNVYEHDFNSLVSGLDKSSQPFVGIRFIMPSENSTDQHKQLALYSTIDKQAEPQNLEYKYYEKTGRNGGTSNSDKIYVWFYDGGEGNGNGDPRPLMICVNNTTYAPNTKDSYFTEWVNVKELSNGRAGGLNECGCPQGPGDHSHDPDNNKLLQELDKVVKFLNQVNIKEGTSESGNGQIYKYNVHKFQNKDIQIQVKCSPVGSGSTSGTCKTSPSTSCYKKFEHKPIGLKNGEGAGVDNNVLGYRLGEVEYITNGSNGNPKGTLNYKSQGSEHPYYPLVSVTVYYYDHDSTYQDPLLIELEFKKINGDGGDGPKEYYKLEKAGGGSENGTMTWKKDEEAKGAIVGSDDSNNQKIVEHLDGLRYSLKKHIKILIEKQRTYDLYLSTKPGGKGDEYKENGNKKIEVEEYKNNGYQKLKSAGYQCYVHKISTINGNGGVKFDYNP